MAFVTRYGNRSSENGWPMVDAESCVWVTIPGTNVSLQIREGQPATIMAAFAADFNAYVEPLRDPDSACWTPTNSVPTSNHMSATAMDLNWNTHPFRQADAGFDAARIRTCRELLAFYEDTIFWGNDWANPKDAMHWQMGYKTFGSEHVERINGFISRKIRPDGFSTFRRAGTVPATPPVASSAVTVLAQATGVTAAKAEQIIQGVSNGLRNSNCDNPNRIAMWLAQMGHESVGFNATEEYASGAAYEGRGDLGNTQPGDGVRFKGRSWIQVTGRHNYSALSKWAHSKGIVNSPTFFVDAPTKLAQMQYAGLGPAWYWTVARPQINSLSDKRNLVGVTQAINGGQNGIADRRKRYDRALALGNQLLALLSANPSTPSTPGDDMALVPQDQWDKVYQELTKRFPSRSPLRHLGEGAVETMAGFVLNIDGSQHVELVTKLAKYGDPDALALLREVAGADLAKYPDRDHDAQLAQAILAEATAPETTAMAARLIPEGMNRFTNQVVSEPITVNTSTGQIIGQAYDALEALQLSGALADSEKAPLTALISVLQTKTQGTP